MSAGRTTTEDDSFPGASRGCGDLRPPLLASRRHAFRFVLIVCGIAILGFLQAHRSAPSPGGSRVPLYLSIAALQLLFVWFVRKGIRARGGSLRDLFGKRWHSPSDGLRDVVLALLFVAALRACSPFLQHLLGQASANTAFLLPIGPLELLLWIGVSIAAGVCEEIVYRGYLQPQLWAASGNIPLAIALQSLVFGVAHVYKVGGRP
ncbi:MAG: CPBP family intramembrane metalloprotease [Verrucomicrobiota bacterium]|nr:CPBP family intramembrane metalloprotease [Verrucomicrobiota bacterium]